MKCCGCFGSFVLCNFCFISAGSYPTVCNMFTQGQSQLDGRRGGGLFSLPLH